MATKNANKKALWSGGGKSSPGLSIAPGRTWTLATPEGCRDVARTVVDLIATTPAGFNMSIMQLPAELRVGYAERLLQGPSEDANEWLAGHADIPRRSCDRFISRVRELARQLILAGPSTRALPPVAEDTVFKIADAGERREAARRVVDVMLLRCLHGHKARRLKRSELVKIADRLFHPSFSILEAWHDAGQPAGLSRTTFYIHAHRVIGLATGGDGSD